MNLPKIGSVNISCTQCGVKIALPLDADFVFRYGDRKHINCPFCSCDLASTFRDIFDLAIKYNDACENIKNFPDERGQFKLSNSKQSDSSSEDIESDDDDYDEDDDDD